MPILTVKNVSLSFDDFDILEDVSFELQKGDRAGLVGVNGSGKTTLLKILTGEYEPDEGSVSFARGISPGYMEQHVCRDLEKPAFDEVMSVFAPLLAMESELESLTRQLSDSTLGDAARDALIARQAELNDRFVAEGGLTCRARARSALLGLGLEEEHLYQKVGVLSGGQKAKLQLAKMLLGGADILLLDEPTNHLDIRAVEWLEDFLKTYAGSYIVVSHDRYFLDKVTTRTFELQSLHLEAYKGNYSRYLELREERRAAAKKVYEAQRREVARIEGIIEQQRRWNQERNYVTIASKQKAIDRIEAQMVRPQENPDSIRFRFAASRRSGDEVLMAKDVSLSFDGGAPLFSGVNLDIRRGEKVFLIGPNGCGKTSLFKILLGQYQMDSGSIKLGAGVDLGYYEQSQLSLNDYNDVIIEAWEAAPGMTQTEIRSALAVFLFRGEEVFKPVGGLSGGERARILLLKLMLSKANFLLLDEPTNHLDIGSCEALEDALAGYDGTLFVVSHDRFLINKLADKLYVLSPDGARLYEGNYDFYLTQREKEEAAAAAQQQSQDAVPKPVNAYRQRKERESALRWKRGAIARLEREIEANEEAAAQKERELEDPAIASDYEALTAASRELAALREQAEELLARWEELSRELEEWEKETE